MRSNGTTPITSPTRSTAIDLTCSACALESRSSPVSAASRSTWNRLDPLGIGGDGDHCDDPATQPRGVGVGAVVSLHEDAGDQLAGGDLRVERQSDLDEPVILSSLSSVARYYGVISRRH